MPIIARIGPIQIRIYYDDHGVPHFHAVSPGFDFKLAIADFSIISGRGALLDGILPRFARGDEGTRICYI